MTTVFTNVDASAGLDIDLKAMVTSPLVEGSPDYPPILDLSQAETD